MGPEGAWSNAEAGSNDFTYMITNRLAGRDQKVPVPQRL